MPASFAANRFMPHVSPFRDAPRIALVRALLALVWAAALVVVVGGDATSTSSDVRPGPPL